MKLDCWQYKRCGREPGGPNAEDLGVCPVAIETRCDGANDGHNGGRICWIVGGTLCGGEVQGSFAQKAHSCLQCDFFRVVQKEQGPAFEHGGAVLPMLCDSTQLVRAYEQLSGVCEELLEARVRLAEQERLAIVGETVAGLAHCLKNTMNALRAGQYVIDRGFEMQDVEKLRDGWRVMKSGVRHVERLTFDMLCFISDRAPERELCDCNEILDEVVLLLSHSARERGIDLRADPGPNLGTHELDRTAIYRALLNLAVNAIDACTESETGSRVVLRSRAVPGGVELSVEDDGIGMSEAMQSRLFTRFFTTKETKGTGLGLLVVKKIAEQHGGSVRVESVPGKGSSFHVHLPTGNGAGSRRASPSDEPSGSQPGEDEMKEDKWVLVVDDREEDVIFLTQILEDHGLKYRVARNGKDALAVIRESRPDLVLLDVMMPRKSGLAVFKEMKADPELREIPIVLVTGATLVTGVDLGSGEEHPKEAPEDGFLRPFGGALHRQLVGLGHAHYVEKPIDPPLLVEKINSLLG